MKKRLFLLMITVGMLCFPMWTGAGAEMRIPVQGINRNFTYTVAEGTVSRAEGDQMTFSVCRDGGAREEIILYCGDVEFPSETQEKELRIYYNKNQLLYAADAGIEPKDLAAKGKAEFLKAIGVLKGNEAGELQLDRAVTRAEYVSLLVRGMFPGGKEEGIFTDCEGHWAQQDISYAYRLGIVRGLTETSFGPDQNIDYTQMVMMAVRMGGKTEGLSGPEDYFAAARQAGLISEDADARTEATRLRAAEILYHLYPHEVTGRILGPGYGGKPVIYLYPEQQRQVQVKLDLKGEFLFTYPAYRSGWKVTACPDGTILDGGKEYSYLFWEGTMPEFRPDFSEGFLVSKEETVTFLQSTLAEMGLIPREYNEFIVYWAPKLMKNEYNKIYFAGEEYEKNAPLTIIPEPDSLLRVFMVYEAAAADAVVAPQKLVPFERKGFTVVEWGGYELPEPVFSSVR